MAMMNERRNPRSNVRPNRPRSEWKTSSDWYDQLVGEKGHYYHQKIVLPGFIRLARFHDYKQASLLDLGCGQGILARMLPEGVEYFGVDSSTPLVEAAKYRDRNPGHHYFVGDATEECPFAKNNFTHAAFILSLQNISSYEKAIAIAARRLCKGGKLIVILNHPCFRIPKQSHWGVDHETATQYRRIDRYLSPLRVPIQTHPSQGERSVKTWSYHRPLSDYSEAFQRGGLLIESIEEWCSDKKSTGKMAQMENRSRKEIPLFLGIVAQKMD